MEKTTIYLVKQIRIGMGLYSSDTTIGFYLSKLTAEFAAYSLNQKHSDRSYYGGYIYSVEEVKAGNDVTSEKEYKKFIDKKKEEIKGDIDRKMKCKAGDELTIKALEKELADLDIKQ